MFTPIDVQHAAAEGHLEGRKRKGGKRRATRQLEKRNFMTYDDL